jgi:cysteine desulfurase
MAIPTIFEESWPSPTKLGADSRSAAILLGESRETIAGHLGIRTDELHFLGEPRLGFHLGITGLTNSSSRFFHSAVDREPAFAVARYLERESQIKISTLAVDSNGIIEEFESDQNDVISWQLINGETGVIQRDLSNSPSRIFYDATSSGTREPLPENWSTALWESRAWAGPAGLGIFGLRTGAEWRNPLPHNDGKVVPGSASPALIVASALAIDSWVADEKLLAQRICDINLRMRGFIAERISGTSFATGIENTAPHLLSLIIEGVDEQQVLAKLLERGIHVDSGSACTATNMDTSHVLAAMKKPIKGNIRFTIHHEITEDEVDLALLALQSVIEEVREN